MKKIAVLLLLVVALCFVGCQQANTNIIKKNNPFTGTWMSLDKSKDYEESIIWTFEEKLLTSKYSLIEKSSKKGYIQKFNYTFDEKTLTCVLLSYTNIETGETEQVRSGETQKFEYIINSSSLTLMDNPDHYFTLEKQK